VGELLDPTTAAFSIGEPRIADQRAAILRQVGG
jgi:hypothetical protein